jgi:fermentation-respiration switch protein FrsA (DUF1100 family)
MTAGYLGLGLLLYYLQPVLLYYPLREVLHTPDDIGLEFENVLLETSDKVQLSAWYVPAQNAKFTILLCHGTGGNMVHRLDSINLFCEMGLNCFIFDYRGYGQSHGKTSEQGTYNDAEAAYRWLTDVKKVPPNKIIIFGRSLGGSIAVHLAANVPARSLVVESSFTTYADIGQKLYPYLPVRLGAMFRYATIENIKNVPYPILIIHSRDDERVPFEFGVQLYEAANDPKQFVEISGSHNSGFLVSKEIYKDRWYKWLEFLDQYEYDSSESRPQDERLLGT